MTLVLPPLIDTVGSVCLSLVILGLVNPLHIGTVPQLKDALGESYYVAPTWFRLELLLAGGEAAVNKAVLYFPLC